MAAASKGKGKKTVVHSPNSHTELFGKTDQERLGLFWDLSYLHGVKHTPACAQPEARDKKGRQMYPGAPKSKCANQDGYFDSKYINAFHGSPAVHDPVEALKKQRAEAKKNMSQAPFIAGSSTKKAAFPGDYAGTFFAHPSPAFSPVVKTEKKTKSKVSAQPFIMSSPGKKGTSSYPGITIGKAPEYKGDNPKGTSRKALIIEHERKCMGDKNWHSGNAPDYLNANPYHEDNPVGPIYQRPKQPGYKKQLDNKAFVCSATGKLLGGCKAGGFEKYPASFSPVTAKKKPPQPEKIWTVNARGKSIRQTSIVQCNVDKRTTIHNWYQLKPVTYDLELKK